MDGAAMRRLMAGLELFPSFLAADQKIQTKQDANGFLQLIILYTNDKRTAEKMAKRLMLIATIKSIPIQTTIVKATDFSQIPDKTAGIFISQNNIDNLDSITLYGEQHSIITFSPFSNDLKHGITGSLLITARIRPHVNLDTVKKSNLSLKPFFLRISTLYPN